MVLVASFGLFFLFPPFSESRKGDSMVGDESGGLLQVLLHAAAPALVDTDTSRREEQQ